MDINKIINSPKITGVDFHISQESLNLHLAALKKIFDETVERDNGTVLYLAHALKQAPYPLIKMYLDDMPEDLKPTFLSQIANGICNGFAQILIDLNLNE